MNRFHKTEYGTRRKYVNIKDAIFQIDVSNELWDSMSSSKITDHIRYWSSHPNTPLKYGTMTPVDSIPDYQEHKCTICNKKYKTRKGLLKHISSLHSTLNESPTETPQTPEVTTQNIKHQTISQINNIQVFDTTEYETIGPSDEVGYVYCFSCESMPGIYKIGMTSRDVEKRLSDANKSGTWKPPSKYTHIMSKRVCNPYKKEKLIHNLLGDHRVNNKREFFKIDEFKLKCLFALLPEASTD